jgi:hypothetical protein
MRTLLRAILLLVVALALQAGLGRVWPAGPRYADVLLVPVVLYGVASTQRAAMLVGCGSGLLRDAWFQVDAFGLSGFSRTLLGWMLAGVSSRLDLSQGAGRLVAGVAVSAADNLMDAGLHRMMEQEPRLDPVDMAVRAIVTGLLSVAVGSILDRTVDAGASRLGS